MVCCVADLFATHTAELFGLLAEVGTVFVEGQEFFNEGVGASIQSGLLFLAERDKTRRFSFSTTATGSGGVSTNSFESVMARLVEHSLTRSQLDAQSTTLNWSFQDLACQPRPLCGP